MGASIKVLQKFFVVQDKDDETLPNIIKRKKRKQRGKDQSPGKEITQKRWVTKKQRKH